MNFEIFSENNKNFFILKDDNTLWVLNGNTFVYEGRFISSYPELSHEQLWGTKINWQDLPMVEKEAIKAMFSHII